MLRILVVRLRRVRGWRREFGETLVSETLVSRFLVEAVVPFVSLNGISVRIAVIGVDRSECSLSAHAGPFV